MNVKIKLFFASSFERRPGAKFYVVRYGKDQFLCEVANVKPMDPHTVPVTVIDPLDKAFKEGDWLALPFGEQVFLPIEEYSVSQVDTLKDIIAGDILYPSEKPYLTIDKDHLLIAVTSLDRKLIATPLDGRFESEPLKELLFSEMCDGKAVYRLSKDIYSIIRIVTPTAEQKTGEWTT